MMIFALLSVVYVCVVCAGWLLSGSVCWSCRCGGVDAELVVGSSVSLACRVRVGIVDVDSLDVRCVCVSAGMVIAGAQVVHLAT